MTTTITQSQVRRLRTEAAIAGDSAQVEVCDRALGAFSDQPSEGPEESAACAEALAECARVIAEGQV